MTNPKIYGTYCDIERIVIWGDESVDQQSRRPRLVFSFRDGNPRITVYTGQKSPNGVISFPCDVPHMVTILNYIKDIASAEPSSKITVDSLTTKYVDNKPTNDTELVSTLHIGKSKEGIVYLSVIAENKPKMVFSIKPSKFHVFRDAEKNVIPDNVISCKMATKIADLLLGLIANVVLQYTNERYDSSGNGPLKIQSKQTNTPAPQSTVTEADFDELGL